LIPIWKVWISEHNALVVTKVAKSNLHFYYVSMFSFALTNWLVNLLVYVFIIVFVFIYNLCTFYLFTYLLIYILRSGSLFINKLWVELGKIKISFKVLG
jgi:hypothetical protein